MSKNPVKIVHLAATALAVMLVFGYSAPAPAQSATEVIPVWPGVPPGSEKWTQKERSFDLEIPHIKPPSPDTLVWNVTRPTLTVFRPAHGRANGTAVIVAPGGGFRVLSWQNEGTRVAAWLADRGITAFVLKYRLHEMPDDPQALMKGFAQMGARPAPANRPISPPPIGPVELMGISDGQEAVKLVRRRASEFGIDAHRIGIIGFSAGGAVSGGAAVRSAPADRPDFVAMIYSNVAGEIPHGAPPAFLAAAADDPLSAGMPDLFSRWRASGASAEMHIYAKGQHGFGTAKQGLPVDHWMDQYLAWMVQQGFVPQPK